MKCLLILLCLWATPVWGCEHSWTCEFGGESLGALSQTVFETPVNVPTYHGSCDGKDFKIPPWKKICTECGVEKILPFKKPNWVVLEWETK